MSEPFDGLGLSLADVIDRLFLREITKAEAATALTPILSATSDGDIGAVVEEVIGVLGRVTGIISVEVPDDQDRPSNLIGAPGSYAWERRRKIFWGPKDKVTGWPEGDVMTEGKSALQVLIDGDVLPPGSTAGDLGVWLANSQTDVIQPIADAAAASATAAAASEAAAEEAQSAAELARSAAEAAASATGEDRAATDLDRLAVAAALTDAETAATTAGDAAVASGSAATAASLAADDAIAARGDALSAKGAAEGAAEATGQDALATAADRQAVADDKTAVAADRTAAETAAETATTKAGEASGHADDAEVARASAVIARNQAEQFKNQAGEIAGGDFLTVAAADGLYRKLLDLLNIADVDGLADALASKATPEDVTAAINALVGAAPGTLDTIYELAAWAQSSGDALAALTTLVASKASQDEFDALVAVVGAIAVPAKTTVAKLRAGTDDADFATAKALTEALAQVAVTEASAIAGLDFATFINPTFALTANRTLGAPMNATPGKSGALFVSNNGFTLAWNAAYRLPVGGITLQPVGLTCIPYLIGASGAVLLFPPTKWAAV